MQILQPLAIGYVGLASRNILYVVGVDQEDLEPSRLQDLKQRDPVHSRRFHGYGLDVARLQPGRRRVQVFRERRETSHRLRISIPRHRDIDLRRSDIYTRSIQVQARQQGRSALLVAALSLSRHGLSRDGFVPASRPRRAELRTLLNEINVPL